MLWAGPGAVPYRFGSSSDSIFGLTSTFAGPASARLRRRRLTFWETRVSLKTALRLGFRRAERNLTRAEIRAREHEHEHEQK
jgi:hypothetical protein